MFSSLSLALTLTRSLFKLLLSSSLCKLAQPKMSSLACRSTMSTSCFLSSVLLALIITKIRTVEHETLSCFGDRFKKTVGGNREVTDTTFTCSSCVDPELCTEGQGVCFRLTTNSVIVFKDGMKTQTLPLLSECLPLRIIPWDPHPDYMEYIVQCSAIALSNYQPGWMVVRKMEESDELEISDHIQAVNSPNSFVKMADNSIFLISDLELYTVTALNNSNQLLIHREDDRLITVPECTTITKLHAGPTANHNLQFLVDCTNGEGSSIRQQVLVDDRLHSDPTAQTLQHPPLSNDEVFYSPGGSYILYRGTSQLVIIGTDTIANTPAVLEYPSLPIADVAFLSDTKLLVSIPGQDRKIVDIPLSFSTMNAQTTIPNSEAFCQPQCTPFSRDGDTLFLFSVEPSSRDAYLHLASYNISNLSQERVRIGRVLKTSRFDICFPVRANVSIPPTTTKPPPPMIPIPPTTTIPMETTDSTIPIPTIDSVEDLSTSLQQDTIGIAFGVIALLLVTGVMVAAVALCICKSKKCKARLTRCTSKRIPFPVVVCDKQTPSAIVSEKGTSGVPSLASSAYSSKEDLSMQPVTTIGKAETVRHHLEVPQPNPHLNIGTSQQVNNC